ncbi:hypothetical protein NM208_g14991 [Fusarium decemcellulare]|uniref:Uncharacterized protein n=1 Tax=Fusarium decemcellulare TaxID=57161 RepID=A0ACC1RG52_9HYPO|nr:hypothetical protein NM208_g14991 [Fusarium decemcellulare]
MISFITSVIINIILAIIDIVAILAFGITGTNTEMLSPIHSSTTIMATTPAATPTLIPEPIESTNDRTLGISLLLVSLALIFGSLSHMYQTRLPSLLLKKGLHRLRRVFGAIPEPNIDEEGGQQWAYPAAQYTPSLAQQPRYQAQREKQALLAEYRERMLNLKERMLNWGERIDGAVPFQMHSQLPPLPPVYLPSTGVLLVDELTQTISNAGSRLRRDNNKRST